MIKVVIDTNIIISAALSPHGNPAKIIDMVFEDNLQLYYSLEILAEYKDVLSRPRLNIADKTQTNIISAIKEAGILVEPTASTIPMPDESDRVFYDTTQVSGAILITGNIKHYPTEEFIMTPSDFLLLTSG